MINEIKDKYEFFSDSLVLKLVYDMGHTPESIDVVIKCMNKLNNYEYEMIQLSFKEIVSFQFTVRENESSVVINAALLESKDGVIVFDFFPLFFGGGKLKENDDSDFKVRCKDVSYALMN